MKKKKRKRNKELKLFSAFLLQRFHSCLHIACSVCTKSLCCALQAAGCCTLACSARGCFENQNICNKNNSRIIMLKLSDLSCHCGRVVFGPIASRLEGSFRFMLHSAVVD